MASKFKEFPTSTDDIETEWCLFGTAVITSATNCCGRKRVGRTKSSEKRTPRWNQETKETGPPKHRKGLKHRKGATKNDVRLTKHRKV